MTYRAVVSIAILAVFYAGLSPSTVSAAKVTPGSTCKRVGSQEVYKGKIYTCIKLGKKLYWNNGKKFTMVPVPSASPTSSPILTAVPSPTPISTTKSSATPSALPTPSNQISNAESDDLQFIYATTDSCANQIGFIRIGSDGVLKRNKVIVKAASKFSLTPLDYQDDELLFKTSQCNAGNTIGKVDTLWRLNLGNPNSRPREVYSLAFKGTRDGIIIDAQIDIASGKTLVFAWVGGDQQIFTAETNPLLIWSLQRQGWLSAGIYGTGFKVSTGWSLSVYAYNNSSSSWRSAYVDWRTEISGIGKVTPRGYGSNAQFQGKGSVSTIRTGILDLPYVFNTSQGLYVCVDYPTSNGAIIDVDTNSRCTRISGSQLGDIATSFAKGDTSSRSSQAVISPSDSRAYVFTSGPIFGTWEPVRIQKTIDLSRALANQRNIFETISTYEISWDIGEVSPTLIFSGFFSIN
jgi:hypothetical protein